MASTIQIKHGSGSNTPPAGALANAELALNVDTGQLWYGSGSSPVTQSEFNFYNVTASSATGSFTGSFTGTFTDADVAALKLQSASLLTYTASNNASITSLKTITASLIAEDTSLKTITASLIAEDTSLKTITASLIAEDTAIKTVTASLLAEIVALKTTTASLIAEDTSLKTITASLIAEDTSLKTKTASLDASVVSFKLETASLHTNTASVAASITSFKLETASLHTFTASGFQSPLSMSVGATLSNTTNIAGTPLYVHGNISSSAEIEGDSLTAATISGSNKFNTLTASIGTRATNTTNVAGTPLYVHGHISASGAVQGGTLVGELTTAAQQNISSVGALEGLTAGGAVDFSGADEVSLGTCVTTHLTSPKNTLTSASVGAAISNTTNPSGIQLYVHGNASGSNKLSFATASFGTPASNTTNPASIPLYVHGMISASNRIFGSSLITPSLSASNTLSTLTASIGTIPSVTTNVAGTPLYVHGNISASNALFGKDIIVARNLSSSGKVSTATASIGTPASDTTNVAGTPLYVHGNISASGNVWSDNSHQFEVTSRASTGDDDNWQGPGTKGILCFEDWNQDYGSDYDDSTSTNDENRSYMNTGWRIPNQANYSCSITSMDIYIHVNENITHADADGFSCSLWYSNYSDLATEINVVDANAGTFVQRHGSTVNSLQCKAADDKFFKFNNYYVSESLSLNIAPGSILFPRIKTVGTNDFSTNIHWIVNYKKIPL